MSSFVRYGVISKGNLGTPIYSLIMNSLPRASRTDSPWVRHGAELTGLDRLAEQSMSNGRNQWQKRTRFMTEVLDSNGISSSAYSRPWYV